MGASVVIYGLANSAILMLAALGFSLIFGLSGVANLAHGGIYLLSGFVAWILVNKLGLPFLLAFPVTVAISGILGWLIYWVVLRRVRGMHLSEVIATFAVGVIILELFRYLGFVTFEFNIPVIMRGGTEILGVGIDYQRLIIIGLGILLALLLWFFAHYTKIGMALRGMAQDEYTALSLGIDSDWAAALSMALGSAMAALAALLILPLGIISINMGYEVLIWVLAVTVLGGMESTIGLIVASLLLGFAKTVTGTYFDPKYMEVVYLLSLVLVLAVKPSGLFGKFKELEERV